MFFEWLIFIALVLSLLAFDLGFLHKNQTEISFSESLWMSFFYVVIAIFFGVFILYQKNMDSFAQYMTAFLVEKTLALDNIFLISLIFTHLSIPRQYQYRVLFYGILGVIVLRALMIGLGAQIVMHFSWVLYVFSVIMILTGVKMLVFSHKVRSIENNMLLIWMSKNLNMTKEIKSECFYIYQKNPISGKTNRVFTPLFFALVLIECVDLIFAVDSIPAVFAITADPYIVYTSNIFAILGLRALFFAISALIHHFIYLKHALALILIFIGSKIFIADALQIDKFPPMISLCVTCGLLVLGVLASYWKSKRI